MKIEQAPEEPALEIVIKPEQCRMARAALRWGIERLATEADLAENTVVAFEAGRSVRNLSICQIQDALEKAGVRFTSNAVEIP